MNYFETFDLRESVGWYYLTHTDNNHYEYYMFSNSIIREGPLILQN